MDIICRADTIIDIGPGAAALGGNIVATESPQEGELLRPNQPTITCAWSCALLDH